MIQTLIAECLLQIVWNEKVDLETMEAIPGYKVILKAVLKGQIQYLVIEWLLYESRRVGIIRIYHECEGMLEKSVTRIAVWHHNAC